MQERPAALRRPDLKTLRPTQCGFHLQGGFSSPVLFAFQGGAQDWLLNLSTSTPTNLAAGSTYVYQIGLNDGTSITFQFSMQ